MNFIKKRIFHQKTNYFCIFWFLTPSCFWTITSLLFLLHKLKTEGFYQFIHPFILFDQFKFKLFVTLNSASANKERFLQNLLQTQLNDEKTQENHVKSAVFTRQIMKNIGNDVQYNQGSKNIKGKKYFIPRHWYTIWLS